MFVIGITKKVTEKLGVIEENHPYVMPEEIDCWHVNMFLWKRKKHLLFMNDKSRYSVIITGVKKSDIKNIDRIFIEQLKLNLTNDGISQNIINHYISSIDEIIFTKTRSRSILGSISDVLWGVECYLANEEDRNIYSQEELNKLVNEWIMMPLEKINLPIYPCKAMKHELEKLFFTGS